MMQKDDWIAIGIFLTIFQILCCWCIDISVSGMINNPEAIVYNGWSSMSPALTYHIGLYGIVISLCFMILILLHVVLKRSKKNARK